VATLAAADFENVAFAGLHINLGRAGSPLLLLLLDPLALLLLHDEAAFCWRHVDEARAASQF